MKSIVYTFLLAFPVFLFAGGPGSALQVMNHNFSTFPGVQMVENTTELANLTEPSFQAHPEYGQVPYRAQCVDCFELVDRRTADSRYFVKNGTDGNTFYVQTIYGELHYQDDEGWWRTIDHRLRPVGGDVYGAPYQPVPTRYDHASGYTFLESGAAELAYNGATRLLIDQSGTLTDLGNLSHSNFSVGSDGVLTQDAWPGVDRVQVFRQGAVKTNFVLNNPIALPNGTDWVVLEDQFELPAGMQLVRDLNKGNETSEGWWAGDLIVQDASGQERFRFQRPVMTDANPDKYGRANLIQDWTQTFIAYEHQVSGNQVKLRIRVNAGWLTHPGRVFPIVVDPLVTGTATFSAGLMGFRYDATCWNDANYCAYNLNVTVPGQSTITDAYFDAWYVSEVWGCGIFVDCWMSEAAFRIVGPCGTSPIPPNYWTCLSPTGDAPGDCTGASIPAGQTVTCITPQCPNYSLTFQMRNYFCFCSSSGCPVSCQYMPNNSWIMTVEARTIESSATANSTPITYIGSCNVPLGIDANPSFGVPGYTYNWSTGPTPNQQTQTVVHGTDGTYNYQVTVTDACGQISVTNVSVVIANCPLAVDLTYFEAEASGAENLLMWGTGQPDQLVEVVVERSPDGTAFEKIGRLLPDDVEGGADFSFVDVAPLDGENHYRLLIKDLDGAWSYSEVKVLKRDDLPGILAWGLDSPSERLWVRWQALSSERVELSLLGVDGRQVAKRSVRMAAGEVKEVRFDTSELSSGVYFLRLNNETLRVLIP